MALPNFFMFSATVFYVILVQTCQTVVKLPGHSIQGSEARNVHVKRQDGTGTTQQIRFDSNSSLWFGTFKVGDGSNLTLLLDTGSANVVLNPGVYVPSNSSVDLKEPFNVTYGTTQSNGQGTASITGDLETDQVTFGAVTASNQTVGSIANTTTDATYPGQGIVGLGSQMFSADNSTPFFNNLCQEQILSSCRFGLALNTNGTGSLSLGQVENDLFEGNLTTTAIVEEWFTYGDVVVNGNVAALNATIEFDSGTANIVGPISQVRTLYSAAGVQAITIPATPSSLETLIGYAPCNATPQVGFTFPAAPGPLNLSSSPIFNVSLSTLLTRSVAQSVDGQANTGGNNNCTFTVIGQDYAALPGLWVLGQSFMQGKYVDHNLDEGTIGIAVLKGAGGGSTTNSSGGGGGSTPSPKANGAVANGGGDRVLWLLLGVSVGFGGVCLW